MKITSLLAVATILFGLTGVAHADSITLTPISGSGSYDYSVSSYTTLNAVLDTNTKLTLNLDYTPDVTMASVALLAGNNSTSSAISYTSTGSLVTDSNVAFPGLSHLIANAISIDLSGAHLEITNVSGSSVNLSDLLALAFQGGRTVSYNYAFSTVPLPAALPLFAAGLVGLGAAAKKRRKA